ncbi:MAG: histidine phosphotransferase family protein [Rhodospirillales bacterium]|nr:histidine phosphotransferase family protein [Rhodospirillales bacterium]
MAADEAGADLVGSIDEPLRLAEFLCARLCHDIAGSLGALMGSLELAREQPAAAEGTAEEAIALANDTGRALVSRLRLLRAAWAGTGTPLDLPSLADLAQGLSRRQVALDISALPPETVFPPAIGRVVLNLVLLAAEALPAGGTIRLDRVEGELLVGVTGPRSAWPAGLGAALAGKAKIEGPRELQAPLTVLLARAAGLALSILMPAGPSEPSGAPPLLLDVSASA